MKICWKIACKTCTKKTSVIVHVDETQMPEMPPGVRKGWDLIFQMIFFLLNVDIWRPINKIENVNIVKLIREWFSVC